LAQLASDRRQVGRWMATVELAKRVAAIPTYEACPKDQIESWIKKSGLGAIKFSPPVARSFEQFLATEEKKNEGSTSFLRNAYACATGKPETLAACLCDKVKVGSLPNQYWFPEDHTSQFRERQAVLSPDLQWIKRSRDRLAHIDLWVHTTFALRKNTVRGDAGNADESTATAVDFPPEQLASLKDVIADKLPGHLAGTLKSPSYDEFMRPLEDFVLLQRFMRAAIAGGLGRDCPLTQLVQLERDTRQFVPYQPTIRWEHAGDSDSMLMTTLKEADPKAANAYITWKKDSIDRYTSKRSLCDRASK
jgi:hypothetical protein